MASGVLTLSTRGNSLPEPPDKQFTIRCALPSDAEPVKALERDAGVSPWTVDDYKREPDRQGSIFLVAFDQHNKALAGFLIMRLITYRDNNSPKDQSCFEFELLNIAVSAKCRRQGLATKLLRSGLDHRDRSSSSIIHLETRASNAPAIGFYEKEGFRVVGRRRRFYSNPTEDAVLLRLEI